MVDQLLNSTRHFERTIRDLETKLNRQQAAVLSTQEMIEAIKALRDKENADRRNEHNAQETKQQAPKR